MTFELNTIEEQSWKNFYHEHADCLKKSGALGECFSFVFTPTGLGTLAAVKCNVCGETKTLTDVDSW